MSMKYTVTEEREYLTQEEINEASREYSPIEPRKAMIITLFVSDTSKEAYRLMKINYGGFGRDGIANDIATAYCNENNIKWHTIEIHRINEYPTHFVIEAIVTI